MAKEKNPQPAMRMEPTPLAIFVGSSFEGVLWGCLYGGDTEASKRIVEGGLLSDMEKSLSDTSNVFGGQFLAMEQALGKLGQH